MDVRIASSSGAQQHELNQTLARLLSHWHDFQSQAAGLSIIRQTAYPSPPVLFSGYWIATPRAIPAQLQTTGDTPCPLVATFPVQPLLEPNQRNQTLPAIRSLLATNTELGQPASSSSPTSTSGSATSSQRDISSNRASSALAHTLSNQQTTEVVWRSYDKRCRAEEEEEAQFPAYHLNNKTTTPRTNGDFQTAAIAQAPYLRQVQTIERKSEGTTTYPRRRHPVLSTAASESQQPSVSWSSYFQRARPRTVEDKHAYHRDQQQRRGQAQTGWTGTSSEETLNHQPSPPKSPVQQQQARKRELIFCTVFSESDLNGEKPKQKRRRKEQNQLEVLEEVFKRDPLPSRKTKEKLAKEVGLPQRAVQVWFQNRRAKERRALRDLEEARLPDLRRPLDDHQPTFPISRQLTA
jgi:hypothetical protein